MAASSARALRAIRRNAVQAAEREEVRAFAAAYLRVSTDEQAQRGNSLPEQEEAVRAYAKAVGLELIGVFADPGVSGTVRPADRPGFAQVLQLATERRFSVLLVKRFDRLARNIALAVTTSAELDTAHGVTIRSVTEAIDTGSPSGKLIFGVLSAMAEQERSVGTVVLIDGGADTESDDDLRVRILLRIRNPPMGGCGTDYEQWTLSLAGVTRVWVAPLEMGLGTVTVRFACDALRAGNDGLPTPDDVAIVKAYLDLVRPVTVADLFVVAALPQGIVPRILNLSNDTPSTRLAIEAALQAMLLEKAAPGQTIFACWISDAITEAVGDATFDLASGDFVMANAGSIASLKPAYGGISYT